jgi:hypothetical protein
VAVTVTIDGEGEPAGPSLAAARVDGRLVLGPNGVAFVPVTGDLVVRL